MLNMKRVSFRVEEDIHKALKFIALEDNTSMQDLLVKAIEDIYQDRIEKILK